MSDCCLIGKRKVVQQRRRRQARRLAFEYLIESKNDRSSISSSSSVSCATTEKRHEEESSFNSLGVENADGFIAATLTESQNTHENGKFLRNYPSSEHFHSHDKFSETSLNGMTPKLFRNSPHSVAEVIETLMKFFIDSNFDHKKISTLLQIIKSFLPIPNRLPVTFNQIYRLFGEKPSFVSKSYCNKCLKVAKKMSWYYVCENHSCNFSQSRLFRRQVTEIVSLNIRQQIKKVVARNIELLVGHEELFPTSDILFSQRYAEKTRNIHQSITLSLHVDGAPLIRSKKSSLWPCFATIAELPPPVREYESNILKLAFWVSCIKPEVDLFMKDIIDEINDLSTDGTTLVINEREYNIHIQTLFFVSDLPAKSLFMKTVNFNGYFACTNCLSKGRRISI